MNKIVNILLIILILAPPAYAASMKLSAINNGGALVPATDQLVAVRSGTTDELVTPPSYVSASGDVSINSSGVTTVTGIQGVAVSTPTGTGGVVLQSSPTINTPTIATGTLTDPIINDVKASTSTLTKTSSTSFSVIPGLSVNLTTSGVYVCYANLVGTADITGGIQVKMVATNSLSATSASFTAINFNGAVTNVVTHTTVTALDSSFGEATAVYTNMVINGTIVVNAGGTLNLEAAQNTSSGTSTTVLQNSSLVCLRAN